MRGLSVQIRSLARKYMTWKIYDIVYRQPNGIINGVLPTVIYADLNKYYADVGFGNLNSKVYQAVKDFTGFEMDKCKVIMVSRYPGSR